MLLVVVANKGLARLGACLAWRRTTETWTGKKSIGRACTAKQVTPPKIIITKDIPKVEGLQRAGGTGSKALTIHRRWQRGCLFVFCVEDRGLAAACRCRCRCCCRWGPGRSRTAGVGGWKWRVLSRG
jgi:hypothetical protein